MGPEGSLPRSQETTIGPYRLTEPDDSSSHLIRLRYILILSSHLGLCLQTGLFPSGCSTKMLHAFLIRAAVAQAV
jgi:hypothetical protein